ncbi:hypothetical protein CGLAR1_07990 [Corynebacterium glutamicum]|uniref:hypothetical protein n=1 Tax=Corynebacterium glutamicum TaxID=1718 RepID=UPI0004F852E3|nr:hypothetical protein CGLAR1_07990 [Corynebacterium glutamicum]AIK87974.1 hypothetical protein AR0_08125 [Corynebacterium glutamicum]
MNMRRRSRVSRLLPATALLASTALLLSACTQGVTDSPDMGKATPAVSPAASNPDGQVIEFGTITDMEVADGDILGVRTEDALAIGTVSDFEAGSQVELDVDKQCGDLTATGGTFVLPCADGVYLIDAKDPDLDELRATDKPVTVAALTSDDQLLVGNGEDEELTIYREGEEPETFTVAGPNTQLIAVPVIDRHDAVVRTWNENTTIQDVDYPNDREGATLRVGLGVGQMAGGEDGLLVVSDEMGSQIAIYNADDVIRLQMTAPTDENPWAVAWDSSNALAWITSLSENTLVGYKISEGVPEEEQRLNTIANAQNLVVLSDSTLVVASATGDGIQIIDNPAS